MRDQAVHRALEAAQFAGRQDAVWLAASTGVQGKGGDLGGDAVEALT